MILDLQPDDVSRIDRVIPPVGDRRDRKSRQKPFPEIPEKNPEPVAESPPPVDDRRPRETDDDDDHSIDLLVLPLSLPTRQTLPSLDASILLHS